MPYCVAEKPDGGAVSDSDNLEIDDAEIDKYLNSQMEIELKTELWEEMHKDYLQEQVRVPLFFLKKVKRIEKVRVQFHLDRVFSTLPKQAAKIILASDTKPSTPSATDVASTSEVVPTTATPTAATSSLVAAGAASDAKSKPKAPQKKGKCKGYSPVFNSKRNPSASAEEAAREVLSMKKKGSTKVNYDALKKLFESPYQRDVDQEPRNGQAGETSLLSVKRQVNFIIVFLFLHRKPRA